MQVLSCSNCVNYEDNKTRFHAMFFIFTIKLSTPSPDKGPFFNYVDKTRKIGGTGNVNSMPIFPDDIKISILTGGR